MKTLVISDTHLTSKFNQKKYNLLVEIINKADQVIINGDFWDGYVTSFDKFVTSSWKQLFPLLKEKNTVYIAGNHDPLKLADERVNLFSDQQLNNYTFSLGQTTFKVQHGNGLNGDKITADSKFIKFFLTKWLIRIFNLYENLQKKILGFSFIDPVRIYTNHQLKKYSTKDNEKHEWQILAHTHWKTLDPDNRYLNSGSFIWDQYSYLLITKDEIQLIQGNY